MKKLSQLPPLEWSAEERARSVLAFLRIPEDKVFVCEEGCAHTAMEFVTQSHLAHELESMRAMAEFCGAEVTPISDGGHA